MKHNHLIRRGAALLLSLALVLTMLAGCSNGGNSSTSQSSESSSSIVSQVEESSAEESTAEESSETSQLKPEPRTTEESGEEDASQADAETKQITLKVVHGDGSEKEFPISTTAETLGEALEAEGLIAGEESSYGLFVTTVDGETVDEGNQEWWCLTKGGGMVTTGVDSTEVSDGDVYELTFTVGY